MSSFDIGPMSFRYYFNIVVLLCCLWVSSVDAGMPALLPSSWTAETQPDWNSSGDPVSAGAVALRIQAISFFVAVFLVSGWLVKALCSLARRDFPELPILSYGRSMGLLTLWGLAFVVVLTMISGARELMTPGAWRKQGWTYGLANVEPVETNSGRAARQRGLEQLRTAIWQYAATHQGQLPGADEPSIETTLWEIPGWPGLRFLTVPECRAESAGRLFAYEPDAEGDDRLVLLTNGFIGTMRTAEIKLSLEGRRAETQSEGELP